MEVFVTFLKKYYNKWFNTTQYLVSEYRAHGTQHRHRQCQYWPYCRQAAKAINHWWDLRALKWLKSLILMNISHEERNKQVKNSKGKCSRRILSYFAIFPRHKNVFPCSVCRHSRKTINHACFISVKRKRTVVSTFLLINSESRKKKVLQEACRCFYWETPAADFVYCDECLKLACGSNVGPV